MKKLIIAVMAVAAAVVAKAATIDWGYTSQASEVGYTVYLYTSAVEASYASFDKLIEGAFASDTVVSKKVGPKTTYKIADNSVASASLGNTLYYVLVSGSGATTYTYGSSSVSAFTYDPGNQESSPGALALTTANFSSSGTIGGTPGPIAPEPTSGLLLLVGMAGLALRRKQK